VAGPVPLWRNHDFVLLWSGQLVSTVGTRVSSLGFPLLVLAQTGSPTRAGAVGLAQTLPYLLLYLPAGALVDRWDRKRVMLVADAVRATALASVGLAVAAGAFSLLHVAAAAFVEGAMFVFFQLSESAALPRVVPVEQLPVALAQNQAREQGAELAGQPLGGLLFGVSQVLPFLIDAVSYLLSFLTLLRLRSPLQASRERAPGRLRAEIGEGLRWVWSQPLLRVLAGLIGLTNLVFAGLTLSLIVRAQALGASAAATGVLLGVMGLGALAGAAVAPWVYRRVPTRLIILGTLWLWVAQPVLLALLPSVLLLGVVAGVAAVPGPMFNVAVSSYRYALAPDRLQARTQSAMRLLGYGMIPLGSLVAGLLLQQTSAAATLLVLAAITLLVAATATAVRAVRCAPQAGSSSGRSDRSAAGAGRIGSYLQRLQRLDR